MTRLQVLLLTTLLGCGGQTVSEPEVDARFDAPSDTATDVPSDVPSDSPGDVPSDTGCSSPVGTTDIPTLDMAMALCKSTSTSCKVCVQALDAKGAPTTYSVLQMPSTCTCPPPMKPGTPPECPTDSPALGSSCTAPASISCAYGYAPIECGGRTVKCASGTWQEVVHSEPLISGCGAGCSAVAFTCSAPCGAWSPRKYDATRDCLAKTDVVQCLPEATVCTGAITCKIRAATGEPYWFPGDCHLTVGWSDCSTAQREKVTAAKACP